MTEREEIKRRLLRLALEDWGKTAAGPRFKPGTNWFESVFEASCKHKFGGGILDRALDLAVVELVELRTACMADMSPVHEDEPDDREWEEQAGE